MSRVKELNHPLADHHLTIMRDRETEPHLFRNQVRRLSLMLAIEASAELPLSPQPIETPMAPMEGRRISARIGIVPILRAGLGMCDAVQELLPQSEIWHLGFYRDETTHTPVEYYQRFSRNPPDVAFILDPMLATGGSASEGIGMVKAWGVRNIALLCIIAAPEGVKKVSDDHPDVSIYCGAVDSYLNENAYIVPGLGDAGDRIFNTL